MRKYNDNGLERVSKKTAERLYNMGFKVLFCPCNLSPVSPWGVGVWMDNSGGEGFNRLINEFEYYNCTNAETGKYTAFYVGEMKGLHLTFSDGSNPWLHYGDRKTIEGDLKKWGRNFNIDCLSVSGGFVYAILSENRKEA